MIESRYLGNYLQCNRIFEHQNINKKHKIIDTTHGASCHCKDHIHTICLQLQVSMSTTYSVGLFALCLMIFTAANSYVFSKCKTTFCQCQNTNDKVYARIMKRSARKAVIVQVQG